MFIFGKDHYSKFCITMFSWQKMAEGEYYQWWIQTGPFTQKHTGA